MGLFGKNEKALEAAWDKKTEKERLELINELVKKDLARYEENHPDGAGFPDTIMEITTGGLASLRTYIEDPAENIITWEAPVVELRYPVEWNWEKDQSNPWGHKLSGEVTPADILNTKTAASKIAELSRNHRHLYALEMLTRGIIECREQATASPDGSGSYILPLAIMEELDEATGTWYDPMTNEKKGPEDRWEIRRWLVDGLARPFIIGAIEINGENIPEYSGEPLAQDVIDRIAGEAKDLPSIDFKVTLDSGETYSGTVVVCFFPMVVDADSREAFYPVQVGLHFHQEDARPWAWPETEKQELWEFLLKELGGETLPAPKAGPVTQRPHNWDPYPIPRDEHQSMEQWRAPATRSIGRIFANLQTVPDLTRSGTIATQKADHIFRELVGVYLNEHGPKWEWRKDGGTEPELIILHGLQVKEAQALWDDIIKTLNAGDGGPGIETRPVGYKSNNRYDRTKGGNIIETQVVLWPEESLLDSKGEAIPPVRFRRDSSPGYLEMIDNQGSKPFFKDGRVYFNSPGKNRRIGWSIGNLPVGALLFSEGQEEWGAHLQEHIEKRATTLTELLMEGDSLFPEDNQNRATLIQGHREAIKNFKNKLEGLTAYEGGPDLWRYIWGVFWEQKDFYIDEKISLPNGKEASTKPWPRMVAIDPKDLRAKLDPNRTWGANWRAMIFRKLTALTTFRFEQTDKAFRIIDTGESFLGRVIDARQGVQGIDRNNKDIGAGLLFHLYDQGALPSDALLVEVRFDFMMNLFSCAQDKQGHAYWGTMAATLAEKGEITAIGGKEIKAGSDLKETAKAIRQKTKANPTLQHSQRLTTFAIMEDWPHHRKSLAQQLLAEMTPNRVKGRKKANRQGGSQRLNKFGGVDYIACNGSRGNGYKARVWMGKASYPGKNKKEKTPGALFVEDLEALVHGLDVRLSISHKPTRAAKGWETKGSTKPLDRLRDRVKEPGGLRDIIVKIFIPYDLETQLSARLKEAGIETGETENRLPAPPLYDCLRTARRLAGEWTQADLADELRKASGMAISRSLIAQWERGNKPIPDKWIPFLADMLGPHFSSIMESPEVVER